ncbi:MAG: sigma-70 family RNA polymerase sigma factor [Myxococcaceae bacterium]|nr:sigma-70 family RNA polymerase sigma factor [Myxococcaceae bacterium]MBH2006942.1 sigma-70 family RNA polymerase sigma factor [Myxococcaceae bacterium]
MLRDPQMLLSYRNGEESAFLALYEKYACSLHRFLQSGFNFSSQGKMCRFRGADNGLDAESLVQETFARAFAKTTREHYDGVRPFQTYLFSIAKNLVLRESLQRNRMISTEWMDEAENGESLFTGALDSDIGISPEKHVENEQLKNIMQAFINRLDAEEKAFFSIRFVQGLTQESTADRMGTTRARIKLLEKNMRKRFLETLRKNGYLTSYSPNPRWKRVEKLPYELETQRAACW